MQIEFLVNGGVSLLLAPENEMEEQLLKQLTKQSNDITEIRTAVTVINKTFRNGILIGKKTLGNITEKINKEDTESGNENESQKM